MAFYPVMSYTFYHCVPGPMLCHISTRSSNYPGGYNRLRVTEMLCHSHPMQHNKLPNGIQLPGSILQFSLISFLPSQSDSLLSMHKPTMLLSLRRSVQNQGPICSESQLLYPFCCQQYHSSLKKIILPTPVG